MIDSDLTGHLQGFMVFIRGHVAAEIPDRGTFDPYGILLKQEAGGMQMVFIESRDDSDEMLKGQPARQTMRWVEDQIRRFRDDPSVVSAAIVVDSHLRPAEGGAGREAVRVWLDDRGQQAAYVLIFYVVEDGKFRIVEETFEPRDPLFLRPIVG